jgi:hypothetical protein
MTKRRALSVVATSPRQSGGDPLRAALIAALAAEKKAKAKLAGHVQAIQRAEQQIGVSETKVGEARTNIDAAKTAFAGELADALARGAAMPATSSAVKAAEAAVSDAGRTLDAVRVARDRLKSDLRTHEIDLHLAEMDVAAAVDGCLIPTVEKLLALGEAARVQMWQCAEILNELRAPGGRDPYFRVEIQVGRRPAAQRDGEAARPDRAARDADPLQGPEHRRRRRDRVLAQRRRAAPRGRPDGRSAAAAAGRLNADQDGESEIKMTDGLDQLAEPAASEQPTKRPAAKSLPRAPNGKWRAPLPSETVETVLSEQPVAEPVLADHPQQPKRSKQSRPFTAADRVRIANLVAAGLSAAEIAARTHRGLPQVSRIVRELSSSTKPTSVPVLVGDSKASCSAKTWAALAAAARRRSVEPATLAVQIVDGTLRRGSVDAVIHSDAELVDDLRTLRLVIDLEAVGRVNGDAGPRAPRDYRLRGLALAHGERAG